MIVVVVDAAVDVGISGVVGAGAFSGTGGVEASTFCFFAGASASLVSGAPRFFDGSLDEAGEGAPCRVTVSPVTFNLSLRLLDMCAVLMSCEKGKRKGAVEEECAQQTINFCDCNEGVEVVCGCGSILLGAECVVCCIYSKG